MIPHKQPAVEKPGDEGFLSWELEGSHSRALMAFLRLASARSGFTLLFLQYNDPLYRDKVIPYLSRHSQKPVVYRPDPGDEYSDFEKHLLDISAGCDLVQVIGLSEWLAGESRKLKFRGFNYHRELLAERLRATLALWMTEGDIRDFALEAPDMWAWRKGVIDFSISGGGQGEVELSRLDLDSADLVDRRRRMSEIETYLADHPGDQISHANLLHELGQIKRELGQIDDALEAFARAMAIYRRDGYKREQMWVLGDIARIYVSKGDVEEALKLHEERLEVYERLGDQQGTANALWSIALIDIGKKRYDSALELLTASYDILLKLDLLEGICHVGLTLGQLLCSMGQIARGLEVLRRSNQGFIKLGRKDMAHKVQSTIDSFPATA